MCAFFLLLFCWQCAIPVFDGLFDGEDGDDILQLLFACAHWHALAKLRMHTDQTLTLLDEATAFLGVKFRRFVNHTCRKFNTRELHHEANARARRAAEKSSTSSAPASGQAERPTQEEGASTRRAKTFNLDTYKYHSLGDYVEHIRQYGTTDSYSTEPVSPVRGLAALPPANCSWTGRVRTPKCQNEIQTH